MVGTLPIRVLAGGLQLSFQLRSVGVQFGVADSHGPQVLEHGCNDPHHADLIGRGPTIDVAGPIQAAGTPHPDWCRPLEVHGRRFAASRPGRQLMQVVEQVIGNVDGHAELPL
jgi:hypothetical protein